MYYVYYVLCAMDYVLCTMQEPTHHVESEAEPGMESDVESELGPRIPSHWLGFDPTGLTLVQCEECNFIPRWGCMGLCAVCLDFQEKRENDVTAAVRRLQGAWRRYCRYRRK